MQCDSIECLHNYITITENGMGKNGKAYVKPLKMATSAVVWCMAMPTALFQGTVYVCMHCPHHDSHRIPPLTNFHSCVAGHAHSI